jgi:tetratricopeptide (TPR) repeat protein
MQLKLWMAAAMMTLAAGAFGQTIKNPSDGGEVTSSVGKNANYNQLQEHQRGGISFMGRVRVADGMLPWDAIPVTVTCNGVPRYTTLADYKGEFTIQGQIKISEVTDSTADPKQASASQLIGCQVQAKLAGFLSSVVTIANLNIMDNPDIGTVTLHQDEHATGYSVSPTTTTASKDALKKFDKARAEWQDKNAEGAEHDLQKAVQSDPKFAEAWYQLGKLQEGTKPADALNSYQKAVAADPQFVPPYVKIAALSAQQKQWQPMETATSQSLKLDPEGTPQIWYFDAVAKYNLGDKEAAEKSAEKALAMDPQHMAPNDEQLLAVIMAGEGNLAGALQHLKNCLTYLPAGPNVELVKQQIAQLEKAVPAGQ